ncbi:GNAT family N-acetyltransferase [Streptomyces sp. ODS28]|uniref:GNAT family N-acetyltransferase n=1 Tax=Streptomyces sp. ODS28 TaxID=3136688 RepID=UPI0031E66084
MTGALPTDDAVTLLDPERWDQRVRDHAPLLPFAALHWLRLGLRGDPRLRLLPLELRTEEGHHLLVPVVRTPDGQAQIGCYGYGTLCPASEEKPRVAPGFRGLAARIGAAAGGAAGVRTLLPPRGLVPRLEPWVGEWPARPGPTTHLLDLSQGSAAAWEAARGSVRTAVRRARDAGLRAVAASGRHAPVLAALHHETLDRNGGASAYTAQDLHVLAARDAVSSVVEDGSGTVQAATVFALGAATGYHLMQLTSAQGRRTNAGHLAFWSALEELERRGARRVDLGSAAGAGQERFKRHWGAVPAATRLVSTTREGER